MTGEFTGRSPKDRFIVKDSITEGSVDWGEINIPFEKSNFENLYHQITDYFADKDLYIKDAYACSDPKFRLNVRLVAEYPWSAHFVNNMFLRLDDEGTPVSLLRKAFRERAHPHVDSNHAHTA